NPPRFLSPPPSCNQLRSLPPALCRLQLQVLLLSHNRLQRLPEAIGGMTALRQLDVSCNELRSLPPSIGRLSSLRDLNVRRNRITALPAELSLLPLVRLDFSCNHVTSIPRCFRRLRHLQALLCDNNPLHSPPPQVCLKGRVHIFKYLQSEHPDTINTCLPTELSPLRPRGGLDSGFNSVDSGCKRWSGNEFSDLTYGPKEKRSTVGGDSDPEQLELLEGSTTGGEEEEDLPCTPPQPPGGSPLSVRWGGDRQRRPPRNVQLWKKRERGERGKRGNSDPLEPSTFLQQTPGVLHPAALSAHHEPPHPHQAPRLNSFLFRVNSAKPAAAPPGDKRTELQQSTKTLMPEEVGGAALRAPCRTPRTTVSDAPT
ncbi:leucine-rich repeat and calponin homology domain-containing protein 4, partial [Coturnix japonica]|uniref:leucine-rich repeat and calponin homology domain-containing protein 4 n=1 Tax=Coturnix japonica TaxID=93934 RepID=UPI0013A5D917